MTHSSATRPRAGFLARRRRSYFLFIAPALILISAVILFPWLFTVWMSAFDWRIGSVAHFVGIENYVKLATNQRFLEAIFHTFYFTLLAVVFPLLLGTAAALIFHRQFPFRGLLRAIFTMPMMATPVAVALVWTMMFHPQQGVLNYLLSLVGLPPSLWVYSPTLVIPSLVLVEIWHWTPLVMLIVLGGLAALPTEPYESARLDGATEWQLFRFITLPLIAPFLIVAAVIRTIDAVKAFDTIYVISQGGPGTASETINLYLYLQAFAFYNVGNASAVGVPAGYGSARLQAHRFIVLILIARMTPALSYLIPLFTVFQFLGLNNTLTALVITHLVITVPIVVYVMAGHFETLPKELEEAALIDGGSAWTLFRYVALPLARPGIVVGTILAFIFSWNNFVFGAVLAGRATRTLPAAVYNVLTFEQLAWGPLAAAAIVVTLPVLMLTIFIQKEIVAGLTAGGVKA